MKLDKYVLVAILATAACFYFSLVVYEKADQLQKESVELSYKAMGAGAPTWRPPHFPDDREPLFQPDPGEVVKQPENKKLLTEAIRAEQDALSLRKASNILRVCGFALLGLLALVECGRMILGGKQEEAQNGFAVRVPSGSEVVPVHPQGGTR